MFHRSLSKAKIRSKNDRDETCLLQGKMLLLSYSYNLYTLRHILHMAYVLAFQSCYNKEPQTQQQKHLFSYCLGGQSRKLMCQDAILPLKARGNKGRLLPCLSLLWEPAHNLWFLALKPYHVCLHNHLAFFPACLTSSAAARVAQRQRICLPVQEMWV